MTELTTLVQAAQQGDKTAFGQIVIRFQDMAYASAYALVGDPGSAQDVAQEAFLDAYLNLAKLREPAAFPGWFRRIVTGHSHRHLRSYPVTLLPIDDTGTLYQTLVAPDDPLDEFLVRQELQQALRLLPPPQATVIALFYVQGYSQQEIADFLETPLSTVKKRLFDARQKLKERFVSMTKQTIQATKPSHDDQFATKIKFFLALRDRDLALIKQLVEQTPSLLSAKTEWQMALGLHYWPLGSTALHLSAGAGYTDIVAYLLTQPVDINEKNKADLTPLQIAVIMGQSAVVELLLAHGADIQARSPMQQTALHHAAMRENLALAKVLVTHGADVTATDDSGRTSIDWAVIRQNQAMIELLTQHGATPPATSVSPVKRPGQSSPARRFLGRVLNSAGKPVDGAPLADLLLKQPSVTAQRVLTGELLPTGIKIIDLLSPLLRGGQCGIFTPLSGVGLMVVLGEIVYAMHALYHGCTVYVFLESDHLHTLDARLPWRECGVDDKMVFIAGHSKDSPAQQQQTVATALSIAEQLRSEGNEVLLLLDSRFALVDGVSDYLKTYTVTTAEAAITTLYHGHHTVGVEPQPLQNLDAVITFAYDRAIQRLYPATDPVRSTSTLLQNEQFSADHRQVAAEAKRVLQRYGDLRSPFENHKLDVDALWYIEDDPNIAQDVTRARRLDRFLTQPFFGAEPWSGTVGELVTVAETIASCQAILTGKADDLPEEALRFVGTLAQAQEKASGTVHG